MGKHLFIIAGGNTCFDAPRQGAIPKHPRRRFPSLIRSGSKDVGWWERRRSSNGF